MVPVFGTKKWSHFSLSFCGSLRQLHISMPKLGPFFGTKNGHQKSSKKQKNKCAKNVFFFYSEAAFWVPPLCALSVNSCHLKNRSELEPYDVDIRHLHECKPNSTRSPLPRNLRRTREIVFILCILWKIKL